MKKTPILIAGFILGAFSVAGVGLVAVTHAMTDNRIAENQRNAMLSKLEAIVPAGRVKNDPLADRIEVSAPDLLGGQTTEIFRVRDGDEPVALILQPIVPDGYAGPIRLLVSVLPDGSLGGVRVLEHHETPGLGDKIDEKKSDWIIKEFTGKSIGNPPAEQWHVKRDGGVFDQFTGATITPRSIVEAVYDTLVYVDRKEQQLYAEPAMGGDGASSQGAKAPDVPGEDAPEENAPEENAPEENAPEENAPERDVSERTVPNQHDRTRMVVPATREDEANRFTVDQDASPRELDAPKRKDQARIVPTNPAPVGAS